MNHSSKFLIIGSGLAGLNAAYYASRYGSVILLTKHSLQTSNSYWAQGGVAVAMDDSDSPQLHYKDTFTAGRGLCNKEAVEILVNEGPVRIKELITDGLHFETINGCYSLGLEGGHSRRRIMHTAGNETGKSLVDFLTYRINQSHRIKVFDNTLVFELLSNNDYCYGCRAFNWGEKSETTFFAETIILASGGAAGIYQTSTNPPSSTGDGIVLGFNAGAVVSNMEFIQFHPTAFYSPSGQTFLISEAVRGEGAYLLDAQGNRFMNNIHELAELAPRDIVSKAAFDKMQNNKVNHLHLSLKHLEASRIKKRFSNIYNEALKFGVDITKDLVPVAPAAHYMIGGIHTDLNACTSLKNLYACGEVANAGVHGANRLAGNSILECLVFSKRAVDHSLNLTSQKPTPEPTANNYYVDVQKSNLYLQFKNQISLIMNENAGITRSKKSLDLALEKLKEISEHWQYREYEYYSERLQGLITVAKLIINGALEREESVGSHLRLDFPQSGVRPYYTFQSKRNKIFKKELYHD